jgi:rfaE bifunctional protein nucleotidyltransferase chain/domain
MWNVSLAFIFHHNVAQIEDKGQPQISRLKLDCLQSIPILLELFPRLFAGLTHSSRLIGKGMSAKIVGLEELSERSKQLHAAGKKLVATNGCFDLLHVGHVRYLQAARALGDLLVVGLNGDRSVRELKGKGRPITAERDRAEILAALQCVDLVTIFPELRATQFIAASHPAIYVKGGDYTSETLNEEERTVLKEIGAEIRIIPFEAGYSTSRLLEQLCENGA